MGFRVLEWLLQTVYENSLIEHHIGLPPFSMGKITYIAPEGQYTLQVQLWTQNVKCSVLCARVYLLFAVNG